MSDFSTLHEVLRYEPETGKFYWKVTRGSNAIEGQEAGTPTTSGYIAIQVNDKKYRAHRLAWFMTYGEWPLMQIDHINNVKKDNRIENLRDVSQVVNNLNRPLARNNKSGATGVQFLQGKWQAASSVGNKNTYIGRFSTRQDAISAYKKFNEARSQL